MTRVSTRQAAKSLGISHETLARYIDVGKVPSPETIKLGKGRRVVHAWSEDEIEHVRKLLPKIANGRKTRWQRERDAQKKKRKQTNAKKKEMRPKK